MLQHSTGNGSNPHDLAVLPDAAAGVPPGGSGGDAGVAFVTRCEPPYDDVALFDLHDGALLGSIDLVPLARNTDHLPLPDQALYLDGRLWVTLQDANGIVIRFVAGYAGASDVPMRVKQAILQLVGHWYENRETTIVGTISKSIEFGVQALIGIDRRMRF